MVEIRVKNTVRKNRVKFMVVTENDKLKLNNGSQFFTTVMVYILLLWNINKSFSMLNFIIMYNNNMLNKNKDINENLYNLVLLIINDIRNTIIGAIRIISIF